MDIMVSGPTATEQSEQEQSNQNNGGVALLPQKKINDFLIMSFS
jgi:hypothetical protein